MAIQERNLKGTATTRDATPTNLCVVPGLPTDGSFMLTGTLTARAPNGLTTTFFPVNGGSIVAGAITQSAGRAQASPCPTSPSDGGTAQGFAPAGCSTLTSGDGRTKPFSVTGSVAALSVVGLAETIITWTWDLTLTVVSP